MTKRKSLNEQLAEIPEGAAVTGQAALDIAKAVAADPKTNAKPENHEALEQLRDAIARAINEAPVMTHEDTHEDIDKLPDGLENDPIRWCHTMAAKMREIAAQPFRPEVKAQAIILAEQHESLAVRLTIEKSLLRRRTH
jgi:hypothetical protein